VAFLTAQHIGRKLTKNPGRNAMPVSLSAQRGLLWWAVAFAALFGLAWVFLLQMVPPPPPSWDAAQVATYYTSRAEPLRLGAGIAAWTSGFMVPLAVVISVQLARLEKGLPIWAITQFAGGIMMSIFLVLPPDFWGAAAFHPERMADATAVMNDLANITLVTTDQYYMFQLVPIIVMALSPPARESSAFPRWFGYYTIFSGLIYEVGPIGFLFRHGPFAWNGLFVFWCPFLAFGAWLTVTIILLFRSLRLQQTGAAAQIPLEGEIAHWA
jgi:hypothetical protein